LPRHLGASDAGAAGGRSVLRHPPGGPGAHRRPAARRQRDGGHHRRRRARPRMRRHAAGGDALPPDGGAGLRRAVVPGGPQRASVRRGARGRLRPQGRPAAPLSAPAYARSDRAAAASCAVHRGLPRRRGARLRLGHAAGPAERRGAGDGRAGRTGSRRQRRRRPVLAAVEAPRSLAGPRGRGRHRRRPPAADPVRRDGRRAL
ncbi:MAG: Transcriptional regulator ArgP, LysR family, partial [uncultured Solirubrobacteraceae bacterium]